MDQIQTTQQQTNNNSLANDISVTTQVDPAQLPTTQISNDLDALLSAEEKLTKESVRSENTLNKPLPKPSVNPNIPQELQGLQLKNPFRGE